MLEGHAAELDTQALNGKFASACKIARMPSKGGARGNTDVRMDSGVLLVSPADRDLAWLQHYSKVFTADVEKLADVMPESRQERTL
eukprot:4441888-Pyramimonas_sp.AAC.3